MIDAIRAAQRADLLQLVLSPWGRRETAGADTGQVAAGGAGSTDAGVVAQGHSARGVFVGVAAQGMGGPGSEAEGDAFCRSQGGGLEAVAGKKVGPGHFGSGRADLFAGSDGSGGGHREGSGPGGIAGPVRDLEPRTLRDSQRGG